MKEGLSDPHEHFFFTQLSDFLILSSPSSPFFPTTGSLFTIPLKTKRRQKQKYFHFCKQSYSVKFSTASTSNLVQGLLLYSKDFI